MRSSALLGCVAAAALTIGSAQAGELRFAFQGDVNSMDPHTLNETFSLGFLGNIYEGLTARNEDLEIVPSLAESWEIIEPTRWRFNLRQGVTFHNGNPFTAADVAFSYERARSDGSDIGSKVAGIEEVVIVDDHTVDFITTVPNPILHAEWDTWYILDEEWSEENGAVNVVNVAELGSGSLPYGHMNANGTGPFMVEERVPDVRTASVPNPAWWGEVEHNLERVVFQPIANPATRVAALLSGEMDMVYPVPLQDVDRVNSNEGTQALTGPELRTIFLGMDQSRDELLYSDIEGENPFKDIRVRQAFYQALDMDAIQRIVMRGASTPSAAMVAPGIQGFPTELERYAYDPDASMALLEEAGYADGFEVRMNCPNDRYVNDEAICQAVVGMLGRVGITVDLLAETRSLYFGKILAQGGYDTSFYLLGWTPGSFDSYNVLTNLIETRDADAGRGTFNVGGYSNAEIDALTRSVLVETDPDARAGMISEAWQILHDDVGYIPLHQQALAWGAAEGVDLVQRADNVFDWSYVQVTD